jgi:hypothetical protein
MFKRRKRKFGGLVPGLKSGGRADRKGRGYQGGGVSSPMGVPGPPGSPNAAMYHQTEIPGQQVTMPIKNPQAPGGYQWQPQASPSVAWTSQAAASKRGGRARRQ